MRLLTYCFLLLCAPALFAQEPDSSSALYTMRDAERAFARASVMYGRKAAFAEFLAEKSVIFTDRWITTGKQLWQGRQATPLVLKWEPEFMDISASGDFGVSTGPWEAQESRPNTPVLSTGYFLSVWQKQKDGSWKVILDAGTNTPKPSGPFHSFSFPAGADKKKAAMTASSADALQEAEGRMLASWKKEHGTKNYESYLRNDSRIMMEGSLPSMNREELILWLDKNGKSYEWKLSGSGTSTAGDLGYTYGDALVDGKQKGNYVRIWKKDNGSDWKILIDLLSID